MTSNAMEKTTSETPETQVEMSETPLLDMLIDTPSSAAITLASGRRYEMAVDPGGDRLIVRAGNGRVLLHITVTDKGPILSFESAEVELRATRALRLDAENVEVSAGHLRTEIRGDVQTRITGTRHTQIDGAEHLEAESIQAQASHGALELRAAQRIALDGEHIGLNDAPCPRPFLWSAVAEEGG